LSSSWLTVATRSDETGRWSAFGEDASLPEQSGEGSVEGDDFLRLKPVDRGCRENGVEGGVLEPGRPVAAW
jgi:hypothetical protein